MNAFFKLLAGGQALVRLDARFSWLRADWYIATPMPRKSVRRALLLVVTERLGRRVPVIHARRTSHMDALVGMGRVESRVFPLATGVSKHKIDMAGCC
jgi:hypothetical protein